MDLNSIPPKQCNEIEQMITEMLKTMRRAKLHTHPIYGSLQEFEKELSQARQSRFDDTHSEYGSY